MREPEISPIQEVEHVVEECMEQNIPIHYDTEINIATFYLLDNLLKRVAVLERITNEHMW